MCDKANFTRHKEYLLDLNLLNGMYFELLEIDYRIVRENGNRRRTESTVEGKNKAMQQNEN